MGVKEKIFSNTIDSKSDLKKKIPILIIQNWQTKLAGYLKIMQDQEQDGELLQFANAANSPSCASSRMIFKCAANLVRHSCKINQIMRVKREIFPNTIGSVSKCDQKKNFLILIIQDWETKLAGYLKIMQDQEQDGELVQLANASNSPIVCLILHDFQMRCQFSPPFLKELIIKNFNRNFP